MRISVRTLRILMLSGNLTLAAAFALHYAYGMAPEKLGEWLPFVSGDAATAPVKIHDLESFRDAGIVVRQPASAASELRTVASWLQPRPPAAPAETPAMAETPEEAPAAAAGDESGPVEGGPLAEEGWEYVAAILPRDQPELSRVLLRKKPPEDAGGQRPVVRAPPRASTLANRRRLRGQIVSAAAQQPGNEFWLRLSQKWYEIKDGGLQFKIESVDSEKLVYWTDDPKKLYALAFTVDSFYLEEGHEKGELKPVALGPEEEGTEEKKSNFVIRPLDYEERFEDDYSSLRRGERPRWGELQPEVLGADPASAAPGAAGRFGNRRVSPPVPASVQTSRSAAPAKVATPDPAASEPLSEAEATQKLGETLQDAMTSEKATEEDKRELRKLETMLRGRPRGANRN